MLWASELNEVAQTGWQEWSRRGESPPSTSGHASFVTDQDDWLSGLQEYITGLCWAFDLPMPRSRSQSCTALGLSWPRCRTLHLNLLNFMRFAWSHFSVLSRMSPDDIPPLQHVDHTTHPGVICKLCTKTKQNNTLYCTNHTTFSWVVSFCCHFRGTEQKEYTASDETTFYHLHFSNPGMVCKR